MPLLYPFVIFLLLLIFATLVRTPQKTHADAGKDEEIARLQDRVAALEQVVLDKDWDLRRKFDGL
jgi:hypothetical protein